MANGKWRVLVADDEPVARRGVRQLLAAHPDFVVVGECRDGREVLTALDRLQPDVLFLDIQMPELDGFDVIRRRSPERMPAVVFLTAYSKFALRAFEADAHDYLVKPVTEARFAATIKRLVRRLSAGAWPVQEPAIAVSTTGATKRLPLKDIDWIEAADNYARIWMGARSYLLRESLDSLEQRVGRHGFARAHRQALVRIAAVRELQNNADGTLTATLTSGATIRVSRRRRAEFGRVLKGRT